MRTVRILVAGSAAAAALGAGGYALAAGDGAVATYTGCLKGGKLESVAVGDAPLAPCSASQPQVRLSGGDVTAVNAGPGLSGGGDSGAVALAIDPTSVQTRITGRCDGVLLGDASISAIHADGSVHCNHDDSGPGTDVFAGFHDATVALPIDDTPAPIARLAVPRGRYLASATLDLYGESIGPETVRCELRAGADFDRTEPVLGSVLAPAGTRDRRLALQVVHEFGDAGEVVIACAADGYAWASFLKIAAMRVTAVANAPLELVAP
jgi:hypothetical protein